MIIYFLLLLLPSHSQGEPFYVSNAAMIHQCQPASTVYVGQFHVKKMPCANKIWKQVALTVDYSCDKSTLKTAWRFTTKLNEPTPWPSRIFLFSVYGKDKKDTISDIKTSAKPAFVQEMEQTFVSSQAPMVSFFWSEPRGVQCRLKYSLPNDLCTAKAGKKFTAKCTCQRGCHGLEFDTSGSSSSERTGLLLRTNDVPSHQPESKGRVHEVSRRYKQIEQQYEFIG